MGKQKSPSIEIPEYTKPTPPSYQIPNYGQSWFKDNTYGFSYTPEMQAETQQLDAMRRAILSGLGITSPQREASLNQWQDTFTKEALRSTMPQLEQTLFERGMGGSRMYQDAITDLLSKVGTQGVLNRENLSKADEALKLQQLASIVGMGQNNISNLNDLLKLSTVTGLSEEELAQKRWQNTLDLLTNVKQSNSGIGGALSGALSGAMAGSAFGLPGIIGGGLAGGGLGYAGSAGDTSTPYALYNTNGGTSSIPTLSNLDSMFGNDQSAYNPYQYDLYSTMIKPSSWALTNPYA